MQLFSADATLFMKKNKKFDNRKLKKLSSKVAQNSFLKSTFFPYCPDCPNGLNGPNRRIPVPKCGLLTNCI